MDEKNQVDARGSAPEMADTKRGRSTPPPVTMAVLVICGTIWAYLNFVQEPTDSRSIGGILAPSALQIWAGAYWALITSAFVHLDIVHLLFNMWWTKDFGRLLEPRFGGLKFTAFILCAAIVGSGWQLAVSDQTGIGFSGVVYAFFGYMLAARDRDPAYGAFLNKNTIAWMIGWLVLCIGMTVMKLWNIGNAAHVTGLIFGFLIGSSTGARRFVIPARIGVGVVASCSLVPLAYMPWSEGWRAREVLQKYEQAEELAKQGDAEGQYYYAHKLFEQAKAEAQESKNTRSITRPVEPEISAVENEGADMLRKSAEQGYVLAMNSLAWRLATDPRNSVRNGKEAVKWAQKTCEKDGWVTAAYIDTLAAAHAELGEWDSAIAFQRKAIEKLKPEEAVSKTQLESSLEKYLRRTPVREP